MLCNNHIEITCIEIDNLVESTGQGVKVIVTRPDKPLWLPAKHVDFIPGMAIIPVRLARKIGGNNNVNKKGRAISERLAALQAMQPDSSVNARPQPAIGAGRNYGPTLDKG